MPGTPLEERPAWRLAQALKVLYLELSNVNIFFDHDDDNNEEENEGKGKGSEADAVRRPHDWRKEAEIKQRFPSRVGDMVRRFFSKNKYNGYVIDMILDRWEVRRSPELLDSINHQPILCMRVRVRVRVLCVVSRRMTRCSRRRGTSCGWT